MGWSNRYRYGAIDIDTGEIFYDSMINIRPNQGNNKKEIESAEIRDKFKEIVEKLI